MRLLTTLAILFLGCAQVYSPAGNYPKITDPMAPCARMDTVYPKSDIPLAQDWKQSVVGGNCGMAWTASKVDAKLKWNSQYPISEKGKDVKIFVDFENCDSVDVWVSTRQYFGTTHGTVYTFSAPKAQRFWFPGISFNGAEGMEGGPALEIVAKSVGCRFLGAGAETGHMDPPGMASPAKK